MATVLENGDVILYQGDTLEYTIYGLSVDNESNYKMFFSIYDKDRHPMIDEVESVISGGITVFTIPHTETDKLTVLTEEECRDYYFGIKLVNTETSYEETLQIGDCTYGDLNTITVYPRKTIGGIE